MKFAAQKAVLPAFPRTAHLPHKPNTDKTDAVATAAEAAVLWTGRVNVEEKLDGASCGMALHAGGPLIRNRDHILRKGYHKPGSAAKMQFAPVWNWWYENREKFERLAALGPYSVFGEWLVARHGIFYDRLPDWFVAYDLYDYERQIWLQPDAARDHLYEAGFVVPSLLLRGRFDGDYAKLEAWANLQSAWTAGKAEGIYVKVFDDEKVTHRFKMVREDFVRGALWHPKELQKNRLAG